jgi:hypothetical protein
MMELLDTLHVRHDSEGRLIEIYRGDLTEMAPDEAVDVLVLSAFPDDYEPTTRSLIGALSRKGVSVAHLAANKYVDLRQAFSCWMWHEIVARYPGIGFKRILCFEPLVRGEPPEVVGDIFRSLAPFLDGVPPIRTVAMPLVACGDAGVPVSEMIAPLLDAAVHWMALGFPLERLKIVARSDDQATELAREFARLKGRYSYVDLGGDPATRYDVFISYSHKDRDAFSVLIDELHRLHPDLRIFTDELSLQIGTAWQQEIFEALDASRRILTLLSPSYLSSKVCIEEFNIAVHRRRETQTELVFPIYLYTAALPTYMKALLNYVDCREGDEKKLRLACRRLVAYL